MTVTSGELQPAVYYPDAILAVLSYLRPALAARSEPAFDGLVVGSIVPEPRVPCVTVTRQGGRDDGVVLDNALLDISCWHTTPDAAWQVAGITRALVRAIVGTTPSGATISRVEEYMGPALTPDPDSTMPRALFSYQIAVRGTALTS